MEIAGAITGLLHRTKVCQTFVNDHSVPLEAVYTHPLPPKASVHGFRLVIGSRVVEGTVQERGQARRAYAQAVSQGHRAALMEEERSDIFTTTVGNIAPGEQVSITFELSGPLEFLESTASLRFPLVVPEVFISGNTLGGGNVGDGTALDTDSVPDASRITPPRLAPGAANPVDLRLSFSVDPAGLSLEKVDSLCHFAKTRRKDDGTFEISLLPGIERMDHDFVVRLQLCEGSLQSTLVHDPETGAFALTVVPPLGSGRNPAPRDLVIVLDRSGSMQGWSMTAARRAAARMVDSLTPQDRFAIIAFDDRCELLDSVLVPAELRHKERAQEFLSKIESRGGTAARPAIERALGLLKMESSADKTVLFITDGDVGNDSELVVRSAGGVRVSTVGIGTNSRAGVLESMAKISGGLCSLIPEESTLEESLRHLHQRLGRPHWMGLSIQGTGTPSACGVTVCDQAPRFWDVWEGVPATFFGKASALAKEVTIEGWLANTGRHSQEVTVIRRDDLLIHRSWARARLLDLDDLWTIGKVDQDQMIALSVDAQVLCRFTAFAAIDSTEVVKDSQRRKTVVQPVESTLEATAMLESLAKDTGWLSSNAPMAQSCFAPTCPAPSRSADAFLEDSFDDGDCWVDDAMELDDLEGAFDCALPPQPSALRQRGSEMVDALRGKAESWMGAIRARRQEAAPARDLGVRASDNDVECESAPPAPSAPSAKKDTAKAGGPAGLWQTLLDDLDRLVAADHADRAIVEKMITALGAHCRQAAAGSPEANAGKEVMSLLIDLQQALESGENLTQAVTALRATLVLRLS
jgi:Ca-activated chloride channel family protein